MAASWLLQAIYTSLLSSAGDLGGNTGTGSPVPQVTSAPMSNLVLANTTFGTIRGSVDNSAQPTIFRYLGVPFAKPPVGHLRFQAPENPDSWPGVKDTLSESSQCWQPFFPAFPSNNPNSEDCLYLNIYTPARASSAGLLPVMVFIHGGGYFLGVGSTYNGTMLARRGDVVVVTINYRLGVLGFLSTEDSVMPGNYGLLDQIHALRWVKDNIAQFGGNPNSVTIFGESAGSGSVSLLVLSPLAKGLFHRAIMESGVSLSPWGHVNPTLRLSPLYGARLTGGPQGCSHVAGQSEPFLKCMRQANASNLTEAANDISSVFTDNLWLLPRVETTFGVLPDSPERLLALGDFNHVDTIRGFNSHENGEMKIRNSTQEINTKDLFIEAVENTLRTYAFPGRTELLKRFVETYIGNKTDPLFISQQATMATSDFAFGGPTLVEIGLASAKSKGERHYLYRYDYRDSFSNAPDWIGAIHGDELKHVFGMDQLDFPSLELDKAVKTAADYAMTDQMMTMWSNFAKTGEPTATMSTVKWEPFSSSKPNMMRINSVSTLADFSRPKIVALYEMILQIFHGSSKDVIG
ncbi:carboxylic ester hydrolase [Plakobranchus ocellatus]|uniref:Carboxylic ester hydrolase n=1 Tax=Plakobranchus ocellatus TaxID=259542 RepID=A0AAV4BFY0_9GAST|nr:carboxylic ester hydrolase [Plakobranchus ocellatus]